MKFFPFYFGKEINTQSEGWFGLGPADQKVKLDELAQYIYALIVTFEKDEIVKSTEPH